MSRALAVVGMFALAAAHTVLQGFAGNPIRGRFGSVEVAITAGARGLRARDGLWHGHRLRIGVSDGDRGRCSEDEERKEEEDC